MRLLTFPLLCLALLTPLACWLRVTPAETPSPAAPTVGAIQPAAAKKTVDIPSSDKWTDSEFSVEYGKCYEITADGKWTAADGKTSGPEGTCPALAYSYLGPLPQLNAAERAQCYMDKHPRNALIAKFSNQDWCFLVGKNVTFISPVTAKLRFRINDDDKVAGTRSGKLAVTFFEAVPKWIGAKGEMTIRARMDTTSTMELSPQGIRWYLSNSGLPGIEAKDAIYPTVINDICWWLIPNSGDLRTDSLALNGFWPNDPSDIKLLNGKSANGTVTLNRDPTTPRITLTFNCPRVQPPAQQFRELDCSFSASSSNIVSSLGTIYLKRIGLANPRPAGAPAIATTRPVAPPVQPKLAKPQPTGPIDVPVACAQPDPNPPARPATVPTADPNAIELPAFQNKPHPLVKSITSGTGLVVTRTSDGDLIGESTDFIATVNPDSRGGTTAGIGILRADGDEMMKTALEEAVRAVRLRYPIWEPGHIDISFGEKFVSHGGPSAGTLFALLMLSELEGFDLDPKCAVTGDITVDWKVRKVGGVTAKLHGATLDKCLYAAIPEDNETAFADMALLYGTSALYNIQVFSIITLQDAEAIARKDRPEKLVQAIKLFDDLKAQLVKSEKPTLQKPETKLALQKILDLAPNHLSAKYLLAVANGTAAKTLSANATLYRINVILTPYWIVNGSGKRYSRETIPLGTTNNARKQIAALRPIANKDFLPYITDASAFVETLEQFASGNSATPLETLIDRARALDAHFDELASDKEMRGKLMREGY